MYRPWFTCAFFLLVVFVAEAAWACPTCKDSIAGDPASANLARGFYYSILFMLAMPYLIFTGMGLYFYSLIRKARLEREAAAQPLLATAASHCNEIPSAEVPTAVEEDELVGV